MTSTVAFGEERIGAERNLFGTQSELDASWGARPRASSTAAIYAFLVSVLFLPHVGLNVGDTSLSLATVTFPVMALVLLVNSVLCFDIWRVGAYLIIFAATALSAVINHGPSFSSLSLLLLLYMPFCLIEMPGRHFDEGQRVARIFVKLVCILCAAGIVQFCLQFISFLTPYLDIRNIIPEVIQRTARYNTIAFSGVLMRSNGFFLLEPSSFSLFTALALLVEWSGARRLAILLLLAVGNLISLSGTGIFMIGVAVLIATLIRSPLKLIGVVATLLLVPSVAKLVGLGFLVARIDEFSTPGSSAYARFVAPLFFVFGENLRQYWSLFLGLGPGSILRALHASTSSMETFDPTWAKIFYEYGFFGALAFTVFVVAQSIQSRAGSLLQGGMIYAWLFAGGVLVNPEFLGFMPLLMWWWRKKRPDRRASFSARGGLYG